MTEAFTKAFDYLRRHKIDIPLDTYLEGVRIGAVKAAGDLSFISSTYNDAIIESLIGYFDGRNITAARNAFRRAVADAFLDAFSLGWMDGGGEFPMSEDALSWLDGRINQEWGHINTLFQQAKGLRTDGESDLFQWATERSDGYTRTLRNIYNQGKLFAAGNKMLTFGGKDGRPDNICQRNHGTCVKLKGARHRASWWLNHDLVPYRGNANYDCGGWECEHGLFDDKGNKFTV